MKETKSSGITRRAFLNNTLFTVGGLVLGRPIFSLQEDLDRFIRERMATTPIMGLGLCLIRGGEIVWAKGYGWADSERRIPYDPERTIQNIGSVSKTFTATAVMQEWESGKFHLDDDVDRFLSFPVKNPRHPDSPITFRQLLTHRSSIRDGPAYGESYACGDPQISLQTWLEEYFTPGGGYYHAERNFHAWRPGQTGELPSQPRAYSNVGFGLLGHLVEVLSGTSFSDYCRDHIFTPLGMTDTAWYLKDLDLNRHARPYTYVPEGKIRRILGPEGMRIKSSAEGEFVPNCLYSFPNYPDGLIRTSPAQLAHFLMAYANPGALQKQRILRPETVRLMLSRDHFGRGLCWFERGLKGGDSLWGHGGGDPGINTSMYFRASDKAGVILFANTDNAGLEYISDRMFRDASARKSD